MLPKDFPTPSSIFKSRDHNSLRDRGGILLLRRLSGVIGRRRVALSVCIGHAGGEYGTMCACIRKSWKVWTTTVPPPWSSVRVPACMHATGILGWSIRIFSRGRQERLGWGGRRGWGHNHSRAILSRYTLVHHVACERVSTSYDSDKYSDSRDTCLVSQDWDWAAQDKTGTLKPPPRGFVDSVC